MDISSLESDESMVDTTLLCRGCLVSSGEMKNMVEWGLLEDFVRITNVQVENSECISQLLCSKCEEMLMRGRQWISQCRESDDYLRNIVKKQADSTEDRNPIISCLLFQNNLDITIVAPDPDAKIHLPCPYKCQNFHKKPDLLHHMIKIHNVDGTFAVNLRYYCFVDNCSYNINSGSNKYFIGRKQLNQHHNKVHKEKKLCTICKLCFSIGDFNRHLKTCNSKYECQVCKTVYTTKEKLLVHLLRKHPDLHKQYKDERKAEKRKAKMLAEKVRTEEKFDYICDSPKRNFATQTLENIKNDVTLPSWSEKDTRKDEISTQTVFEDLLSLKSDDESIFCSETVSLSDIQTQTFPLEFGLSRSNKETITSETQSPDLSLKGTQTCLCLYDSPRSNRFGDSVTSSPGMNFTSTETQTADLKHSMSDVLLSFSTTETQTCFDELKNL